MKAYRGSPGILQVAGLACGFLQAGRSGPFPSARPAQAAATRPAGGQYAKGGASAGSHRPAGRPWHAPEAGPRPGYEVELTEVRTPRPGLVDPGLRGDRPRRPAVQRTPGHRRSGVRPRPARQRGTRPGQNPGLMRNGCPHGRAPKVTHEGCPCAEPAGPPACRHARRQPNRGRQRRHDRRRSHRGCQADAASARPTPSGANPIARDVPCRQVDLTEARTEWPGSPPSTDCRSW